MFSLAMCNILMWSPLGHEGRDPRWASYEINGATDDCENKAAFLHRYAGWEHPPMKNNSIRTCNMNQKWHEWRSAPAITLIMLSNEGSQNTLLKSDKVCVWGKLSWMDGLRYSLGPSIQDLFFKAWPSSFLTLTTCLEPLRSSRFNP